MIELNTSERYVIINADDLGITRSTNQAIIDMFQKKLITSASIMMPCSAAKEAAESCKESSFEEVGVHLTLTSTENFLLKPVFQDRQLKSLTTKEGFFPLDASELEKNADPEEVRIELTAQIKRAISYGLDPTHLDSHAGSILGLHQGRDFLEIVFDLCEEFALPFNLPLKIVDQPIFSSSQKELFAKRIVSAKTRGIFLIDDLSGVSYHSQPAEEYIDIKKEMVSKITHLKPGVTQFVTHPAFVTPELKTLTPHYLKREMEYCLYGDPDIKELLIKENIKLVSWKDIREIQRSREFRYRVR
jgi:predicted glycoside hydrolase/deacetylase ChbG (UPF0249 family)